MLFGLETFISNVGSTANDQFNSIGVGVAPSGTAGDVTLAAAGTLSWSTRTAQTSPSDGVLLLQNNAKTDFARVQLGGTTSAFPAIKRSGTTVAFRLADDSAQAAILAQNISISGSDTFMFAARSVLGSSGDGVIELYNNAQTGFTRLNFGGVTSAFPAIKRNGAAIDFRLADDSAYAIITATQVTTDTLRDIGGAISVITAGVSRGNLVSSSGTLAISSPDVNSALVSQTGGSLTGSSAVTFASYTGTWNTSGTPTAFKWNITDTSSNAASLLIDLQVGSVSKFAVRKDGRISVAGSNGVSAGPFTAITSITVVGGIVTALTGT